MLCSQEEGVKVFVLLYKEIKVALNILSDYSKQILMSHCPENIKVIISTIRSCLAFVTLVLFFILYFFFFFVILWPHFLCCIWVHLRMCALVHLFVHSCMCVCLCTCAYVSMLVSVCVSVWLSLPVYLPVSLSLPLSVWEWDFFMSVYLLISWSIYLCVNVVVNYPIQNTHQIGVINTD